MSIRQKIDVKIAAVHGAGKAVKKILITPQLYLKLKEEYNDFLETFGTYGQRYDKDLHRYKGCKIEVSEKVPFGKDLWVI